MCKVVVLLVLCISFFGFCRADLTCSSSGGSWGNAYMSTVPTYFSYFSGAQVVAACSDALYVATSTQVSKLKATGENVWTINLSGVKEIMFTGSSGVLITSTEIVMVDVTGSEIWREQGRTISGSFTAVGQDFCFIYQHLYFSATILTCRKTYATSLAASSTVLPGGSYIEAYVVMENDSPIVRAPNSLIGYSSYSALSPSFYSNFSAPAAGLSRPLVYNYMFFATNAHLVSVSYSGSYTRWYKSFVLGMRNMIVYSNYIVAYGMLPPSSYPMLYSFDPAAGTMQGSISGIVPLKMAADNSNNLLFVLTSAGVTVLNPMSLNILANYKISVSPLTIVALLATPNGFVVTDGSYTSSYAVTNINVNPLPTHTSSKLGLALGLTFGILSCLCVVVVVIIVRRKRRLSYAIQCDGIPIGIVTSTA